MDKQVANSRLQVINKVPTTGGAIIGVRGSLEGAIIAIDKDMTLTIGRDPKNCNVIMEGEYVSRIHFSLNYNPEDETYMLRDFSTNGVILQNGQVTKKGSCVKLKGGQHICIGTYSEEILLR